MKGIVKMDDKLFSVLIVDDNKQNLMVLADLLESEGYEVGFALNGRQALEYISHEKPDLILLDVMMPEMDRYETCSILKKDALYKEIPVIFLTAKVESEDIVRGFECGGVDYIQKPFNSCELKSRVRTHLSLKRAQDEAREAYDALIQANKSIENKNKQLNLMIKKLDYLSKTDSLTNLYNRRYMIEQIEKEILNCNETGTSFIIVMSDIDYFKVINDTYGHDFGDFVLREISDIMQSSIRRNDILSRWGGEEYLLLLKDINVEKGFALTEIIRESISKHNFIFNDIEVHLTMTFGVAEYICGNNIDEVIKNSDNALYKGKKSGRNTVAIGN